VNAAGFSLHAFRIAGASSSGTAALIAAAAGNRFFSNIGLPHGNPREARSADIQFFLNEEARFVTDLILGVTDVHHASGKGHPSTAARNVSGRRIASITTSGP
jgi:hypothetical protein